MMSLCCCRRFVSLLVGDGSIEKGDLVGCGCAIRSVDMAVAVAVAVATIMALAFCVRFNDGALYSTILTEVVV